MRPISPQISQRGGQSGEMASESPSTCRSTFTRFGVPRRERAEFFRDLLAIHYGHAILDEIGETGREKKEDMEVEGEER